MEENKKTEKEEIKEQSESTENNTDNTPKNQKKKKSVVVTLSGHRKVIKRNSIHKRFEEANVEMMSTGNLPYYAEFNLFINFHEANIGTCGVNVTGNGMHFYWDRKFVDQLTPQEAKFLIIHEDFHLIFDHQKRSVGYDKNTANLAQDMIINQIIHDEIMSKYKDGNFITIPKHKDKYIKFPDGSYLEDENGNKVENPDYGNNMGVFIPKEYKGVQNFEELYGWLVEKYNDYKQRSSGQSQKGQQEGQSGQNQKGQQGQQGQQQEGQGQGQQEQGDGNGEGGDKNDKNKDQQQEGGCGENGNEAPYGDYGQNDVGMPHLDKIFENMEQSKGQTLDQHIEDEISEEMKKEIVDDAINNLKARGLETGDMEKILRKLRKSKKDYLKKIKRVISADIFGSNKNKTITRPNRRNIKGLKGHKKYQNRINCILDTSGSMSGEFEKVLSYIFQNDIVINLIQVDTEVQSVNVIKNKKEIEKTRISGLGGTVIQPGLDYISDKTNKLNKYNTVILTDGFTDSLNFSKVKGNTLILSTSDYCNLTHDNGRVKQIIIEKNQE